MENLMVKESPLPWWAAGIMLGLVQVLAIGLVKPLGVSTQFVVANTKIINQVNKGYVENHPLISKDKYQKFGYGWWLVDLAAVVHVVNAHLRQFLQPCPLLSKGGKETLG